VHQLNARIYPYMNARDKMPFEVTPVFYKLQRYDAANAAPVSAAAPAAQPASDQPAAAPESAQPAPTSSQPANSAAAPADQQPTAAQNPQQ
jgi:hypothetical protein